MLEVAGLALSAVQTLLAALQRSELGNIRSIVEYKSQLDDLQGTVEKLESVLHDAAEIEELLTHQDKVQIDKIKDAVYEAGDLFDEFVTLAQQKQLLKADGRVSEKFRSFFSFSSNPASVAYRMSHGVKKIKKTLDAIIYNNQFSFKHDPQPIRNRRPDTCSYVNEVDIVGRGDDLEKIVGMLLDPSDDHCHNVSFLSVVGIGGLGKTALAQLVFNDPRVKSAFSLRKWTCVADQDQKELDVEQVLCKILDCEGSTLQHVQSQLRNKLAGERYLLVLDDVWTEKHIQWRELVQYLIGGQKGSWIVVTTRSHNTAEIVGGEVHELQGLSEEDSWSLFEQSAFTSNQSSNPPDEWVKIGRKIVDRCAGVPLAIKVVGSFLYGQDRGKWKLVQEMGLATIRQSENDILPILKLSFHHLESPLKSCFAYCALFPKDSVMEKEMLKSLWMAQGYIVPLDKGQSIEDACEEYFSILLRRCFFQEIERNDYGEISSCKIHDLMHDIALDVSGKEIFYATDTIRGNLDKDVRHLSVIKENFDEYTLGKTHIHSYLHLDYDGIQVCKVNKSYLESLVANCLNLKALDLSGLIFESLPDSVCKKIKLRYLNISGNTEMKFLPKSITELHNLQTLILRRCHTLIELPAELSRLQNLRLLDIRYCFSLTCMPRGMGALTYLHNLSDYIVGGEHWNQLFDGLDDLKPLHNLRGCLNIHIRWPKNVKYVVEEDSERGELCLGSMEHLNAILFDFIHDEADGSVGTEDAERLIEKLQPHHNLKYLEVKKYHGLRMPGWVTLLSNLVELHLTDCRELTYLPCLGKLLCLKVLRLIMLANLECIGEDSRLVDSSSTFKPQLLIAGLSYLPPLETLEMSNLPKLKGWRRGVEDDHQFLNDGSNSSSSNKAELQLLPCFSDLKSLFIWNCPELTCFPPCPKMEDLTLLNFNSRMQMIINCERDVNLEVVIPFASSSSWSPHPENSTAIKKVAISNVSWLNSVPVEVFQFVESLEIWGDMELGSLGEAENVFRGCLSSLRYLMISNCCTLRSVVPGGLEHLTALEKLEIRNCNNLGISEEHQEEGVKCIGIAINDILPLPSNHHSLRTLTWHGLPQLVNLPIWMQFLPALQSLEISFCNRLKSMPNWMPNLQSLTHLTVFGCSKSLERRCQEDPPGKDRPYIKHIPNIQFQECFY